MTAGDKRVDAALLQASYKRTHEAIEACDRDLFKWQGGARVIHVLRIHAMQVLTLYV